MGWFWARASNPTTTSSSPTPTNTTETQTQPRPQTTDPSMALFLQHLAVAETIAEAAASPISPAESQYPTTMSCRQAFDLAVGCQSIAGQTRNVYRYGGVRVCSEQWADFWFCMRVKSTSGPVSEKMIRDHYRHKEHRKYHAPAQHSSEHVWESRERSLPVDAFFNEPIEPPTETDDQWRKTEIERRRMIRDSMGYNPKTP